MGFGELFEGGVCVGDVGCVVFVVVQFYDFVVDVWFQGCEVVGKVGECVGCYIVFI